MQANKVSTIPEVLKAHQKTLLEDWMRLQLKELGNGAALVSEDSLRLSSKEFLNVLTKACEKGVGDVDGPEWADTRNLLTDLSRTRAAQGFTPVQTAMFVYSFKQPLFERLKQEHAKTPEQLADEIWNATMLLDKLGLYTFETFQRTREEIIRRQQQEMLELSTPVIRIWDGVVAVPLIGTLDSARTQLIMENLLQTIIDTNSKIAILDITGVPTVDTQTAQHLIKTVSAARLMGADCIISGIRPQIAQTIVHLGIEINDIITKATMADAVKLSLVKMGWETKKLDKASLQGSLNSRG